MDEAYSHAPYQIKSEINKAYLPKSLPTSRNQDFIFHGVQDYAQLESKNKFGR